MYYTPFPGSSRFSGVEHERVLTRLRPVRLFISVIEAQASRVFVRAGINAWPLICSSGSIRPVCSASLVCSRPRLPCAPVFIRARWPDLALLENSLRNSRFSPPETSSSEMVIFLETHCAPHTLNGSRTQSVRSTRVHRKR